MTGLRHFILFLSCCIITAHSSAQRIRFDDARIAYTGRIAFTDSAALFWWTASSLKIRFSGTGVKLLMQDEHGNNYYNVIVDGKVNAVLHPDSSRREYRLAAGLPGGEHQVEIFKRTEWAMGRTAIYALIPDSNTTWLPPPPAPKRRLEVFGNSITCGYAVEDSSGKDRGTAPYENGYLSYAAILARHYDAAYHCSSKSGIGIMVSWFPLIMPEMYNRMDPNDPSSVWDFSRFTPDLVLINLFQNDEALTHMPEYPQFKARFGNKPPSARHIIRAYRRFLRSVRNQYPQSRILCILGSMSATRSGSPWPGYIDRAVHGLRDDRIQTHFIPYKNSKGHPNVREQNDMAEDLIRYIDEHIHW